MSRKLRKIARRLILPDYIYQNIYITKFINYLMESGKRSIAEAIFYEGISEFIEFVKENKKADYPLLSNSENDLEAKNHAVILIFMELINKLRPAARLKSKRIGGANYQVPVEISQETSFKAAMKMIISAARSKTGRSMAERLSAEFINVLNEEGEAIKKRNEMIKRIEASKAFAHFL